MVTIQEAYAAETGAAPGTATPDDRFEVLTGAVPRAVAGAARRRLLLELRRCGVSAEEIAEWSHSCWWPSLRHDPAIAGVRPHLEHLAAPGDVWAETQILIRLPDEDGIPLGPPHVDSPPPWAPAAGLRYKRILSVELSDTPAEGGGTVLHLPEGLVPIRQGQGDVLSLRPDVPHSGSPNFSADIRLALFFRLLEPVHRGAPLEPTGGRVALHERPHGPNC